jgi:error-prone DNA polymerase
VPYEHHSLEGPLGKTLGAIIFQDQVIEVAIAFAGFTPGEAEGLRRAMSRRRSVDAIERYHSFFVEGAVARWPDVDEAKAERVFAMVAGFSGFGFPKGHGAAFGLLAYQSTYLRVHYGPEFLCALLNEQPMGFYPADALVHEAQRRGIPVLAPDVNLSGVECTVTVDGAVRIGLGYIKGLREAEARALVAMREQHGLFHNLAELAARAGVGRSALEQLAWSGACDTLLRGAGSSTRRRIALWQLGMASLAQPTVGDDSVKTRGNAAASSSALPAMQMALPLELPQSPPLAALAEWDRMIADYATTRLTSGPHPLSLLRGELSRRGTVNSAELRELGHDTAVKIGGLVVARQRPGTAKGICFLLLEDECGTINLIVPAPLFERQQLLIRSEPLVLASGRLQRHPAAGGAMNLLVDELIGLERPGRPQAAVHELSSAQGALRDVDDGGSEVWVPAQTEGLSEASANSDFRAVAPAVMSFGAGRRR